MPVSQTVGLILGGAAVVGAVIAWVKIIVPLGAVLEFSEDEAPDDAVLFKPYTRETPHETVAQ